MNYRAVKLAALIAIILSALWYGRPTVTAGGTEAEPQRRAPTRPAAGQKRPDYTKFSHQAAAHRLACNSCHKFPTANWKKVRTGAAAFPDITDYPEHASCLSCHRQQFFQGAQPAICTVCHTNPSPRDSSRHPFPNPREIFDTAKVAPGFVSEFGISFPHDKHIDIVGQNQEPFQEGRPDGPGERRGFRFVRVSLQQKPEPAKEESDPKSCAVCHLTYQPQGEGDEEFVTKPPKNLPETAFWLKKGTFKTSPTSHATCFTCHSEDSGLKPAPTDCATCHTLLPPAQQVRTDTARDDFDPKQAVTMGVKDRATLEKWSRRDTARFRHEWLPHAGLSCTSCHTVATMNTRDEKTKKVPILSCGGAGSGCHIEATDEGILNLEVNKKKADSTFTCTKCHVNNGSKAAPESHSKAVAAATKK